MKYELIMRCVIPGGKLDKVNISSYKVLTELKDYLKKYKINNLNNELDFLEADAVNIKEEGGELTAVKVRFKLNRKKPMLKWEEFFLINALTGILRDADEVLKECINPGGPSVLERLPD